MVTTLIVSQGSFASAILESARVIAGDLHGIECLCTEWGETLESTRDQVEKAVRAIDEGDGVLVLTDLCGATPTNAARMIGETAKVEVVCGVNLPMVVRLACRQREWRDLSETAAWIAEKGSRAIRTMEVPRAPVSMKAGS